MKYILHLPLLFILLQCQSPTLQSSKSEVVLKTEIDSLLNKWHQSAASADFDAYFGLMDSLSVFIGTDITENWSKSQFMDFAKPFFDRGKAWDFHPLKRNIYFSKNREVVWFDESLNTWMGLCQASGVFEWSANGWKLKHYVLSVAVPNEDIRAVIKAKTPSDSLLLEKFGASPMFP